MLLNSYNDMELKNWKLLENAAKSHNIEINPNTPRVSRLAVAIKLDELGKIPEAIEAMTGVANSNQDSNYMYTLILNRKYHKFPNEYYKSFKPVDK